MTYRFGPFEADRIAYRVVRGGRALELTPKLLDLLFYLLERPATLVTKEALLADVWPGANVTDNALAQAVSDLREALGDRAAEPTYILTVARRGYRFVAPVTSVQVTAASRPNGATVEQPRPAAAAAATPTVAVMDFVNVTGDNDVAWLSSGIAETVTNDLAALGGFQVIDRLRVMQAASRESGSVEAVAAALGLSHAVVGSFQRQGSDVRITARLLDLSRGATLADAKVDGPLAGAFALQDRIVGAFARAMGAGANLPARGARAGGRETASLDAYRALTEGWLKLESLDTDLVPAAITDFERAIQLDSRYVMAHAGLASAEFVAYEMSRATSSPNLRALTDGIAHARHAVSLDPKLAEAHATLSFLLVSAGEMEEARTAAAAAIDLEPENWRHQFRLGHAQWGEARLRACASALATYPEFEYARFEMAMVFVARGDFDRAEELARHGVVEQDRHGGAGQRFPVIGFHWLLGAMAATGGRIDEAIAEFDRELAQIDTHRLYGPEYGAMAAVARGHALIAVKRFDDAVASFELAERYVPRYPYAGLGLRHLQARAGQDRGGRRAATASPEAIARDRSYGGVHGSACELALSGRSDAAIEVLERGLATGPPSFLGWTIPVEPAFSSLRNHPRFARVLQTVADRAR